MRTWAERLLFPPHCLLCGGPGSGGLDLCAGCERELPRLRTACCCCGEPLPVAIEACGRCQRRPPPFERTLAALRYRPPVDRLILDLKYRDRLATARLLGELLRQRVTGAELPQALLPVPLHPARLAERGYNQALELARPLAVALDRPLLTRAVVRVRATPTQTVIDRAARQRNLRGAFACTGLLPWRHLALVDDVMTTGSTLRELATVLRAGGVERIQVWVCARAGRDDAA
ncbi:MAG: ComF family protein [Candidatus Competibacterales bacterium]|nr:ComF family protein [Candidatus Competibacterales bacterium]